MRAIPSHGGHCAICVLLRDLEFGIHPKDVCMVGLHSWKDQEIDLIRHDRLNVFSDAAKRGMKDVAREVHKVLAKWHHRLTRRKPQSLQF